MATTSRVRQSRALKRRRIIERPRLFSLLDESSARVRTLVAAAGYGKTTLAHQWVHREGRRGAWFTARRSSTDVAALALGVARAATGIFPGCDLRLREHLRAVPNPGERVDVLAEILGEELMGWGHSHWLVIDDYHELAAAADAERFVAELVDTCPLQILIASRQRPSWISSRSILYGEILELSQTVLAMDSREAAEVLSNRSSQSASGLVALANGWPAVIALAAVSSAELEAEIEVPESLYRFFAEEIFDSLGDDVRQGLALLAVAPLLDRELADELLGDESAEVCSAALDVGILEEREELLELHPLARSFLEEWASHRPGEPSRTQSAAEICLRRFKARRDWDAAYDVISRRGPISDLAPLLEEALDELLETARLSTIENWCGLAADADLDEPMFSIARAEVALRHGRHAEAQSFAEAAAVAGEPRLTFRGLAVAGRAAHLASREEDGLQLFRRAEAAATSEPERRDALWGQVMCEIELERPEAAVTLAQLNAGVQISDAPDRVRAATHTLMYQIRMATIDLGNADIAAELVNGVKDPLTESAFQSVYSSTLALSARYEEALAAANAMVRCAEEYRLDFAVPYACIAAAMAHAGLRRFREATDCLKRAVSSAQIGRNNYAQQLAFAVYVRACVAQGRHDVALSVVVPDLRGALPAIRGEVLGSRALALASAGRTVEAEEALSQAVGISRAVEITVLQPAVVATSALKRGDASLVERVRELEEVAFSTGAVDLLVTTYRATPELLGVLLRASQQPERVVDLLRRVRDDDLARLIGQPVGIADDPADRLSQRERDVYGLLCEGLPNKQIAQLLFISEATVKVHVHHIYDKLGVRSRTSLVVQAALRRADQATATSGSKDGESS